MTASQTTLQRISRLIPPLYLPSIMISIAVGIQIPVLPLFAEQLGNNYTLIGIVLAGQGIGTLLTDMPGGIILARLGGKRTMISGTLITGLASLAMISVQSHLSAFIFQMISGAGISIFSLSRHAYIADEVEIDIRGKAVGLIGGVSRFGKFLGPLIGGITAAKLGLRMPFVVIAGCWLVTLIFVMLFVPKIVVAAESIITPRQYTHNLIQTWRYHWRILLSAGGGQLLAQMVRRGRDVLIPLYGANVLGLSVDQIGYVLAISGGIDMLFFLPSGFVMDRFGRKFSIVPAFILQGVGLMLIPLTTTMAAFAAVSALIGFGNGLSSGTMMTLGADLAPPGDRSTFLASWRVVGSAGSSFSPVIIGSVADIFSLPQAIIIIGLSGILSSLIFGRFVPETLRRDSG